jgi:hypothetical protein
MLVPASLHRISALFIDQGAKQPICGMVGHCEVHLFTFPREFLLNQLTDLIAFQVLIFEYISRPGARC